jgi:hypothetical protein
VTGHGQFISNNKTDEIAPYSNTLNTNSQAFYGVTPGFVPQISLKAYNNSPDATSIIV